MPIWSSLNKQRCFIWKSASAYNGITLIENTIETGLFGVFLLVEMSSEIWKI